MAFWNRAKAEQRSTVEDPTVPLTSARLIDMLSDGIDAESGVVVNAESALGVPAIWAAVNFISGTIAGLPLMVYEKKGDSREKSSRGIASILHDAVSNEMSSFDWRKYTFERVLTSGRSFTLIVRDQTGDITGLEPLIPEHVTVRRGSGGLPEYVYDAPGVRKRVYLARQIIDVSFAMKADLLNHWNPIRLHRDTIGLGIAATKYGSKLFQNGGVPPFVLSGNFQSGAALNRASDDLQRAIRKASKDSRLAVTIPTGHELKTIGLDPEKSQLVELKRFLIEEYARIYSLPPVFLQDLSHGTFSNTEQQDLHFVKHTIKRWVEQFEQELNLKIFGRGEQEIYAEFNLDGLLRGDFKTRMDGYAQGIQNGVLKPNEARRRENLPDDEHGGDLMIQGATVPIKSQGGNDDSEN